MKRELQRWQLIAVWRWRKQQRMVEVFCLYFAQERKSVTATLLSIKWTVVLL